MKSKIVTFAKEHNYGGVNYKSGDQLELPPERAEMLRKAGVLRDDSPQKAKKQK